MRADRSLMGWMTVAALGGVGSVIGPYVVRHGFTGAYLLLGSSTALLFPIAAFLEMAVDPQSHNLWPFEFLLYAVLVAGPAVAGAFIGSFLQPRRRER